MLRFLCFFLPYLLIGHKVIRKAFRNIRHGQIFDENFLMLIATAAAFVIGEYAEALAVMLFYQIGEFFQSYAVGRSRRSIEEMMSIVPKTACVERDGEDLTVDPEEVDVGVILLIRPGERIPLDGTVIEGESRIDTSALTGESVPRGVRAGDPVISGCVNGNGILRVEVTKPYEDSTVSKILELVEEAGEKKAKTEQFITRFARVYTPIVTIAALALALIPPLVLHGGWQDWIYRACTFLIVSCPCALVISVPLGFFGGIGAASKVGILIKGSNYLEALSRTSTLFLDKTGTLTKGSFAVTSIEPATGVTKEEVLTTANLAEAGSLHPIAVSIREAAGADPDQRRITKMQEIPGMGIAAVIDGEEVLAGNGKLLDSQGIEHPAIPGGGTVILLAKKGRYFGAIRISDEIKEGCREAMDALRKEGVKELILLTGDRKEEGERIAEALELDRVHSELLPDDKVRILEEKIKVTNAQGVTAYAGDGINDAPVLVRSDVGIAMGSMGSDAAIEAADIVLMDDDPGKLSKAIGIAKKTMRIVRENIAFSIIVKLLVLILGALGIATLWLAVFADVGVAVLAILNSMRALRAAR